MEPVGSQLYSTESTIGPYPEADALVYFRKILRNILIHTM
jgi:hypothetical protein